MLPDKVLLLGHPELTNDNQALHYHVTCRQRTRWTPATGDTFRSLPRTSCDRAFSQASAVTDPNGSPAQLAATGTQLKANYLISWVIFKPGSSITS